MLAALEFGTDFSNAQFQIGQIGGDGDGGSDIPAAPDITPLLEKMAQGHNVSLPGRSFVFTKQTIPPITSQSFTSSSTSGGSVSFASPSSVSSSSSGGKSSSGSSSLSNTNKLNRIKKPKPKSSAQKSKVIKFHEYKGPPNVVKNQQVPTSTSQGSSQGAATEQTAFAQACDTPHHRRMLQQQLFLQLELQLQQQHKNLPLIIPSAAGANQPLSSSGSEASITSGIPPTSVTPTPTPPGSVGAPTPTPPPPPPPPLPRPLSVPATSMTVGSESGIVTSFMITTAAANFGTNTMTTATALSNLTRTTQSNTPNTKVKTMEDFKVAELKAECKKRGLTVSGPKPVLIERLKNFQEEILSNANRGLRPEASAVATSLLKSDTSVTSPVSLPTISGVINIQPITPQSVPPPSVSSVDDSSVSMTIGSPPLSPTNTVESELNTSHASILSGPLSPSDYSMDIASPPMLQANQQPSLKSELSGSQSNIPMAVDGQVQSRPPSVAPMDIDLAGSLGNLTGVNTGPLAPPPPPPPPPPLPASRPASVVSHHTPSPQQLNSVSPHQGLSVSPHTSQSTTPVSLQNVMSPPQLHGQPQINQAKLVTPQTLQLQLQGSHSSGSLVGQSLQAVGLKLSQSLPQLQAAAATATSTQAGTTLQHNLQATQAQLINSLAQSQTQSVAQTVAQSQALQAQTNLIQQQLQQLQQNQQAIAASQNSQQQQLLMLQQIKTEPQQSAANQPALSVGQATSLPQGTQPSLVTQEEILKQQQSQIDELKKQLELSQKQLKEAQDQAQKQQDELKKTLAQAQAAHVNLVKMANENKVGTLMQMPQISLGQSLPQQTSVTGQPQLAQPPILQPQVQTQFSSSILKQQQNVVASEPPQLQPVQPLQQVQPQQHSQPPQLQQQQQQQQQQTPQKQPGTSVVAPQATATGVNRGVPKKQPVLAHIQIQPITSTNSQPGATHSISITPSTGTTTISEETKAQILNDLINSKVLQQTLNLPGGMPKMLQLTATGGPNSHSYILTAAPSPPPPGAVCTTPAVSGVTPISGTSIGSRSGVPTSSGSNASASLTTSMVTSTVPSVVATSSSSQQRPQIGKAPKNNQKKKKDKEQRNKLKVKQNNQINATASGKPLSNNTLPINGLNPR